MDVVINVTNKVDMSVFEEWTQALKRLREGLPEISECAVYGGAVLDKLLGLQPDDLDVMYEVPGSECRCDEVRGVIASGGIFSDEILRLTSDRFRSIHLA